MGKSEVTLRVMLLAINQQRQRLPCLSFSFRTAHCHRQTRYPWNPAGSRVSWLGWKCWKSFQNQTNWSRYFACGKRNLRYPSFSGPTNFWGQAAAHNGSVGTGVLKVWKFLDGLNTLEITSLVEAFWNYRHPNTRRPGDDFVLDVWMNSSCLRKSN